MSWDVTTITADLGRLLGYTTVFVAVLTIASLTKDWLTPRHRLNDSLVHTNNAAVGVILSGYYLAVAAVFAGAALGPSRGFEADLALILGYSALGIAFLNLSRLILDKVMFRGVDVLDLVVSHRNVGTASSSFGATLATGLIAGAAVFGEGGGWISSIVFFVLGQAALTLFAWLYERATPYDVHSEIVSGNLAAGIAFAGNLIGLGLILARAVGGPLASWQQSLGLFAIDLAVGATLLIGFRFVLERLLLRGGRLNKEISEDQNVAAGLVEAASVIGLGGAIAALL